MYCQAQSESCGCGLASLSAFRRRGGKMLVTVGTNDVGVARGAAVATAPIPNCSDQTGLLFDEPR
jgi:hypothetical protein